MIGFRLLFGEVSWNLEVEARLIGEGAGEDDSVLIASNNVVCLSLVGFFLGGIAADGVLRAGNWIEERLLT